MRRVVISVLTAVAMTAAASAASAAVVRAKTSTAITQRASVEITSALTLPSANFLATGQSNATTLVMPVASTTTVRLTGDAGQAVSLSMPESFEVVRTSDGAAFINPLEGSMISGNSLSVNVSGIVALAPQALVPESFGDFVAVVAQYN